MRSVPESDANDLIQEVLMKVFRKIGTFQNDREAQFTTWIFQIARNHTTDFHRAKRRRRETLLEDNHLQQTNETLPSCNPAEMARLKDALEQLHPDDQKILSWRANDQPYAQIAKWLQIKTGTARVRYLRAKRKIEATLNRMELTGTEPARELQEAGVGHD